MSEPAEEIVRAWYRGLREGDWHELVPKLFDEQVVYLNFAREPDSPVTRAAIPWAGEWLGHDGVRRFQALIEQNFQVLEFEDHTYFSNGSSVAVFSRFAFIVRSTGQRVVSDGATLATVRDGRIDRYHFHENTFAIAAAFRTEGRWTLRNSLGEREIPPEEDASRAGGDQPTGGSE